MFNIKDITFITNKVEEIKREYPAIIESVKVYWDYDFPVRRHTGILAPAIVDVRFKEPYGKVSFMIRSPESFEKFEKFLNEVLLYIKFQKVPESKKKKKTSNK